MTKWRGFYTFVCHVHLCFVCKYPVALTELSSHLIKQQLWTLLGFLLWWQAIGTRLCGKFVSNLVLILISMAWYQYNYHLTSQQPIDICSHNLRLQGNSSFDICTMPFWCCHIPKVNVSMFYFMWGHILVNVGCCKLCYCCFICLSFTQIWGRTG